MCTANAMCNYRLPRQAPDLLFCANHCVLKWGLVTSMACGGLEWGYDCTRRVAAKIPTSYEDRADLRPWVTQERSWW